MQEVVILDDKKIITALNKDDELGYTMLIDAYTCYVTAIITGIAKGRLTGSDVEEAAADVFYRIWLKREGLLEDTLKAYVAQAARNASVDRLRKMNQEFIPYEDDILQIQQDTAPPDELAIIREQKQLVKQAVDTFCEPDREIFIRFYFFGETLKTIAQRLQLNLATTKTKLYRSKARLKKILMQRGYEYE